MQHISPCILIALAYSSYTLKILLLEHERLGVAIRQCNLFIYRAGRSIYHDDAVRGGIYDN